MLHYRWRRFFLGKTLFTIAYCLPLRPLFFNPILSSIFPKSDCFPLIEIHRLIFSSTSPQQQLHTSNERINCNKYYSLCEGLHSSKIHLCFILFTETEHQRKWIIQLLHLSNKNQQKEKKCSLKTKIIHNVFYY